MNVAVAFNTPGTDALFGMDPDDVAHWIGTGGVSYQVDTDCSDPEPVLAYGCSQGFFKLNGYGTETTLGGPKCSGRTGYR